MPGIPKPILKCQDCDKEFWEAYDYYFHWLSEHLPG